MDAVGGSKSIRILGDERLRKRAAGFRFTEGAVWRGDDRVLIFSDIPGNRLYRFDPSTEEVAVYRDPSNLTNGNLFDRQHRLISCEHGTSRVVREERDGKLTMIASHYDGLELNSPNDIVEDRQGRLYFTDPPYGRAEGSGRPWKPVFRGHSHNRCRASTASIRETARLIGWPMISTGRTGSACPWTRRGCSSATPRAATSAAFRSSTTSYPAASLGRRIGRRRWRPRRIEDRQSGHVYSCGPDGVHVFGPDARQIAVVKTPEICANFNWGDPDRRTLYLCCTSSLYSRRVEVPGLPRGENVRSLPCTPRPTSLNAEGLVIP